MLSSFIKLRKLKVLFMGSGLFALEVLKKIQFNENLDLVAVFTQPDKPFGRKKILTPTIVGSYLKDQTIPLFKAQKSSEILDFVSSNQVLQDIDYILVADYGVLLSEQVLGLPNKLCLNVHGSLLPKYRGASPVHAAILSNEAETGVCIITMEKGLDAGPVWGESKIMLTGNEFYQDLLLQLGQIGGELLCRILPDIEESKIAPKDQNPSEVTYASKILKEDGLINLEDIKAETFWAKYRAYINWPQIYFIYKNLKFVLVQIEKYTERFDFDLNNLARVNLFYNKKKFFLKIDQEVFIIVRFKPESKPEMDPYSFSLGNPDFFQEVK